MSCGIKYETLIINKNELEGKSANEIQKLVNKRLANLNNGDIVIMSSYDPLKNKEKHLEEAKFHVVCKIDSEKYLSELEKTPSGEFNSIPLSISKSLVNLPKINVIKSYSQLFNEKLKFYKNSYQSIELDFKLFSSYLPENTNIDILVKNKARLFYFFTKPIDGNNNSNCERLDENFYVWFDKPSQSNNFHLLTSNIEDLDLEDDFEQDNEVLNETIDLNSSESTEINEDLKITEEERDPEMEDFANQFKSIYENQFRDYLKKLKKNDTLNATSLPTKKYNKDTYEEDSMNSTTIVFYFDKLEQDENGNINSIVTTTFDKSESVHFTPSICKSYGPYFKTTLYCSLYNVGRSKDSEANKFFLDLPIDLYNLID